MSGFETNRSRIESELIQSMMKKTGYLNEIIKQLQEVYNKTI